MFFWKVSPVQAADVVSGPPKSEQQQPEENGNAGQHGSLNKPAEEHQSGSQVEDENAQDDATMDEEDNSTAGQPGNVDKSLENHQSGAQVDVRK